MFYESYLGRLGTYVRRMFAKSTLAASPHLTQVKVESYDDFSPEWDQFLIQLKAAAAQASASARVIIEEASQAMPLAEAEAIKMAFR